MIHQWWTPAVLESCPNKNNKHLFNRLLKINKDQHQNNKPLNPLMTISFMLASAKMISAHCNIFGRTNNMEIIWHKIKIVKNLINNSFPFFNVQNAFQNLWNIVLKGVASKTGSNSISLNVLGSSLMQGTQSYFVKYKELNKAHLS